MRKHHNNEFHNQTGGRPDEGWSFRLSIKAECISVTDMAVFKWAVSFYVYNLSPTWQFSSELTIRLVLHVVVYDLSWTWLFFSVSKLISFFLVLLSVCLWKPCVLHWLFRHSWKMTLVPWMPRKLWPLSIRWNLASVTSITRTQRCGTILTQLSNTELWCNCLVVHGVPETKKDTGEAGRFQRQSECYWPLYLGDSGTWDEITDRIPEWGGDRISGTN